MFWKKIINNWFVAFQCNVSRFPYYYMFVGTKHYKIQQTTTSELEKIHIFQLYFNNWTGGQNCINNGYKSGTNDFVHGDWAFMCRTRSFVTLINCTEAIWFLNVLILSVYIDMLHLRLMNLFNFWNINYVVIIFFNQYWPLILILDYL